MQFSRTLKEQRLKLSLTQAEVAKKLGVSTPAVNKWEKGITFPDISLLSPLARLLKIDVNTLLSFQDELSENEIELFFIELQKVLENKNFEEAFRIAMEKIKEFPNCTNLIYIIVPYLNDFLQISQIENKVVYEKELENYYYLLSRSKKFKKKELGLLLSFIASLKQDNYTDVKRIINEIPDINIDKDALKTKLNLKQNENDKAKKLINVRIIKNILKLQHSLLDLIDVYHRENNTTKLQEVVRLYKENIKNYDLPKQFEFFLDFQLSLKNNNLDKSKEILKEFLIYLKEIEHLNYYSDKLDPNQVHYRQFNILQNFITGFQDLEKNESDSEFMSLINDIRKEILRLI